MKRLLVTGSRGWTNVPVISEGLMAAYTRLGGSAEKIVLVHGAAPGADTIAAQIWSAWGLPTEPHPANWSEFGRSAGPIRNQEMVALGAAEAHAFRLPDSKGTKDCIDRCVKARIRIHIYSQEHGLVEAIWSDLQPDEVEDSS